MSTTPQTPETQQQPEPVVAAVPAPVPAPPPTRVTVDQLRDLPESDHKRLWINSLVEAEAARLNYAQDRALAIDFAACGEFGELKNKSQTQAVSTAMVKIQLGRSWGFSPADSMRSIYFVNGKPAVENAIVASRLRAAGWAWDPDFAYVTVEEKGKLPWNKCTGCTLWLKRYDPKHGYQPLVDRKQQPVSVSFTLADAEHAKIYEKGETKPLSDKFNYQSFPEYMYYWRAIGKIWKYYAPEILRGGISFEERFDVVGNELAPEEQPVEQIEQTSKPSLRDRVMEQGSFLDVNKEPEK